MPNNNKGNITRTNLGCVGDITAEPPTNIATYGDKAAKMADFLDDLPFPATKE